ncbi:MAG: right-handed parallel beta-helix repeat-containing protein [Magnetococcales bacterium]|nr:right-handed parallel beta-helix repeat-containing protein [Magnetococcales bacterium]
MPTGCSIPSLFLMVVALFLSVAIQSVHATSYFIDAKNGSNANDGLSAATAWRTPDVLSQRALVAGDAVLFRRGGRWSGHALTLKDPRITIASYGTKADGGRPILSGAVSILREPLFNDDFDLHEKRPAAAMDRFPGWKGIIHGSGGQLRASRDTATRSGVSAELSARSQGDVALLSRVLPGRVAGFMPVRFRFRVKVESGRLFFQVRHMGKGLSLGPDGHWHPTASVAARVVQPKGGWQWITVNAMTHEEPGEYDISFVAQDGVARIDDVQLVMGWKEESPNLYQRVVMLEKGEDVRALHLGGRTLGAPRRSLDGVTAHGHWFWDRHRALLSVRFNKGGQTLGRWPLEIERGAAILVEMNGPDQSIRGLVLQQAREGVRIRADRARVEESIIRWMGRYSVTASSGDPRRDIHGVVIRNNTIHDVGNGPFLVHGVGSRILSNQIERVLDRDQPTDNLAVTIRGGRDNRIENNVIASAWMGINIWGRRPRPTDAATAEAVGNSIARNTIDDVATFGIVLGGETEEVRLKGVDAGRLCGKEIGRTRCGVRGWVSGTRVHHNLISRCGLGRTAAMMASKRPTTQGAAIRLTSSPLAEANEILNNTLVNNWSSVSGDLHAGNFLLANTASVSPNYRHLDFPGKSNRRGDLDRARLRHNLFHPASMERRDKPFVWRGRMLRSFEQFVRVSPDSATGSLSKPPLFTDAKGGNWYPASGSPLIDAGAPLQALASASGHAVVNSDLTGRSFPQGSMPDIGAFESALAPISRNSPETPVGERSVPPNSEPKQERSMGSEIPLSVEQSPGIPVEVSVEPAPVLETTVPLPSAGGVGAGAGTTVETFSLPSGK